MFLMHDAHSMFSVLRSNATRPAKFVGTFMQMILALLVVTLTSSSMTSSAHAQVFADDFSDGAVGAYWQKVSAAPSIAINETGGRLEFSATAAPTLTNESFAGYYAKGWSIRTTNDFFMRVQVNSQPNSVGSALGSTHGVAIALSQSGTPPTAAGFPVGGAVISVGALRASSTVVDRTIDAKRYTALSSPNLWLRLYAFPDEPFFFYNSIGGAWVLDLAYTATIFLSYSKTTDTLYFSALGYGDPDAQFITNLTQGQHYPVALSLGGFAKTPAALAGSNEWLDTLRVETGVVDTAPGSVAATDGTLSNKVRVTWTAAVNALGYKVLRQAQGGDLVQLAQLPASAVAHDDTTALPLTSYTYFVRTVNANGDGFEASDAGWRNVATPTGVTASDSTYSDKVLVSWTAVNDTIGYSVWRSIGAATATLIGSVSGSATVTYDDTSAVAGTVYTYGVKGVTALGSTVLSATDTGSRAPAAPSGVTATQGTVANKVRLDWTPASGATAYKIHRALEGGSMSLLATVSGGTTAAYSDLTALALVSYSYTVKTVTLAGDSLPSDTVTGWRNAPAPKNVLASPGTSTTDVTVQWTTQAVLTGYIVNRQQGANPIETLATLGTVGSYTDSTASPLLSYSYTIIGLHSVATGMTNSSAASIGWRNVDAPALNAASDGDYSNKVRMTWDAVTQATGYTMWRSLAAGGTPTQVGTITDGSTEVWNDTTAVIGVSYLYQVRAVHALGSTLLSVGDTGWRNAAAPTAVLASDGTFANKVVVTWAASAGATGYKIYRALGAESAVVVGTVSGATIATFNDTTVPRSAAYIYTVAATTAPGESTRTVGDSGWRTPAVPTAVAASAGSFTDRVTISWNLADGAAGYKVYRQIGAAAATLIGTIAEPSTIQFVDSTIATLTNASYTVKSTCALGTSVSSAASVGWRNVAAPANVLASDGLFTNKVRITWSSVAAATSYRITRQIGELTPVVIATVASSVLSYNDTTIAVGTVGSYTVQALHALGATAQSTPDTGYRASAFAGAMPLPPADDPSEGAIGKPNDASHDDGSGAPLDGDANETEDTSDVASNESNDIDFDNDTLSCDSIEARIEASIAAMLEEATDDSIEATYALAAQLAALLVVPESGTESNSDAITQSPACAMLGGDVDLDGAITPQDFTRFMEAWLANDVVHGDITRDGRIDAFDLALVLDAQFAP